MTATKFTFRMTDGKYPVTARGRLQWLSDRAKAIEMGQSVGAAELVEMDDNGKVLATLPLPNSVIDAASPQDEPRGNNTEKEKER
jgi:hypothetical protein